MPKFGLGFAAIILSIAATACGHIGISSCAAPQGPQLLFPNLGATGIVGANLTLYFAYGGNPAASGFSRPRIVPSGGGPTVVGGPYAVPSPGPLPPGSATPQPGFDQVFVSTLPTAAPATTYSVVVIGECGSGSLGTFSTQ